MTYRRRQDGYTDDFIARHKAEQEERERERAERQRNNEAARREYLAGLEAKRQEERERGQARVDAQIEPEKQRRMRAWLIDHPDKSAADFERQAWPLIREELTGRDAIKNKYLAQARGERV